VARRLVEQGQHHEWQFTAPEHPAAFTMAPFAVLAATAASTMTPPVTAMTTASAVASAAALILRHAVIASVAGAAAGAIRATRAAGAQIHVVVA
jgi:hypothetical protein